MENMNAGPESIGIGIAGTATAILKYQREYKAVLEKRQGTIISKLWGCGSLFLFKVC
jgi:hypothetical protein